MKKLDANQKKTAGFLACLAIAALLFVLIPVTDSFTMKMKVYVIITVFCIANIAMNTLPTLGLALILPALYIAFDIVPVSTAFGSYAGSFLWMALGALYLGRVMDETNFLKRISYKLISLTGGSFTGAVWGVFLTCFVINFITFGVGWVICLPVIVGMCKAFDLQKSKESALICFAGMCGAANMTPVIYAPANVEMYNTLIDSVLPECARVGFLDFPIRCWFTLIACALAIFIFTKLYERGLKKGEASAIANQGASKEHFLKLYQELGRMSVDEWKCVGLFAILLVGCIGSAFWGWNSTVFFLTVPYIALIPVVGCKGDVAVRALKGISFDGMLFSTSCLAIGTVGTAVGFNAWLADVILPFVDGRGMFFTIVVIAAVVFFTNFILTPSAIVTGLGGSLMTVGYHVGIAPVAVASTMTYMISSIVMPHEVATFLMMYSMGYWSMKDFAKQEGLLSLITFAGLLLVVYPFWQLVGLI